MIAFIVVRRKEKEKEAEQEYICDPVEPIDYTYQENACYLQPQLVEQFDNYYNDPMNVYNLHVSDNQTYDLASSSNQQTYDNAPMYDMGDNNY